MRKINLNYTKKSEIQKKQLFRGAAHSICNLRYKVPKEIPVVIHNGWTYEHHFIIKQLAEKFKVQFECLGENAEKYITFSVSIKKELIIGKTIIYKWKFIDSFRFMSTSLSSLVDNLTTKNAKRSWKEKILNQNVILLGLKIINYVTNVKNIKKYG